MRAVKRILVPTDFSPPAACALEEAIGLANVFGASVTLFHVYGLPAPVSDREYAYGENLIATLGDAAERNLAAAREDLRRRVPDAPPIEIKALLGFAADEIVAEARRGSFDLIVMGTHGRIGLKHMLLGSVAERVVRMAPVPVMTVHPVAEASAAAEHEPARSAP
jgi:nucleotide-binding universal stress UspA family protein